MRIVSILENQNIEKRIALTLDSAKKYIELGFNLSISENYGKHLGINDEDFKELGVNISKDEKELIEKRLLILSNSEEISFSIKRKPNTHWNT